MEGPVVVYQILLGGEDLLLVAGYLQLYPPRSKRMHQVVELEEMDGVERPPSPPANGRGKLAQMCQYHDNRLSERSIPWKEYSGVNEDEASYQKL
jgi:hypothetical protein